MKNKLFLKVFFGLGLFFSLLKIDLKSENGISIKSEELKKTNLNDIDENKVLKDYAKYIVNIIFSNSGILDNIQNEEQEDLIKKQMEKLADKIFSNKEFRELGKILLKEQIENILIYKNFNKKINLLKLASYSLVIIYALQKSFKTNENYSKYINSFFSGISGLTLINYFENLSKKEKNDNNFENGNFENSQSSINLIQFCYEKVIKPYFDNMQKEAQKNEEEVQKVNQSSND